MPDIFTDIKESVCLEQTEEEKKRGRSPVSDALRAGEGQSLTVAQGSGK